MNMQKKMLIILLLGVFLISFVNAQFGGGSLSSLGDLLNTIPSSTMILGAFFIIFFALIFFALSKVFRDRYGETNKAIASVVSLAASLLMVYGINKMDFDFEGFFFDIGISSDILYIAIPLIILVGLIFLFIKLRSKALFILGGLFILLSFTDLIYEKVFLLVIGIILIILGLWLTFRKRGYSRYESSPRLGRGPKPWRDPKPRREARPRRTRIPKEGPVGPEGPRGAIGPEGPRYTRAREMPRRQKRIPPSRQLPAPQDTGKIDRKARKIQEKEDRMAERKAKRQQERLQIEDSRRQQKQIQQQERKQIQQQERLQIKDSRREQKRLEKQQRKALPSPSQSRALVATGRQVQSSMRRSEKGQRPEQKGTGKRLMKDWKRDGRRFTEVLERGSESQKKSIYRKLLRKYHPDVNNDNPTAIEITMELSRLYQGRKK